MQFYEMCWLRGQSMVKNSKFWVISSPKMVKPNEKGSVAQLGVEMNPNSFLWGGSKQWFYEMCWLRGLSMVKNSKFWVINGPKLVKPDEKGPVAQLGVEMNPKNFIWGGSKQWFYEMCWLRGLSMVKKSKFWGVISGPKQVKPDKKGPFAQLGVERNPKNFIWGELITKVWRTDGRTDRRTDRRTDGRTDGWTDGRTETVP